MIEREHALNKVAAGDYLLPRNDGQTIWRIALDNGHADRDHWTAWEWRGEVGPGAYVDTLDWSRWDLMSGGFLTRREAMDAALAASSLRTDQTGDTDAAS